MLTSCPYLVWETQRDWWGFTEEWSELEVNQCAQNRATQTDWPINYRIPLQQPFTSTDICAETCLLRLSQKQIPQDVGYYSQVAAASVQACMSPSVRLWFACLWPCLSLHRIGEAEEGRQSATLFKCSRARTSQQPTVAGLKEALCEGQTDGYRMKTVMIPSTAQYTYRQTDKHTHSYTGLLITRCNAVFMCWRQDKLWFTSEKTRRNWNDHVCCCPFVVALLVKMPLKCFLNWYQRCWKGRDN